MLVTGRSTTAPCRSTMPCLTSSRRVGRVGRMRESVANGGRVSSARTRFARIHGLSKPGGAASAAAPNCRSELPKAAHPSRVQIHRPPVALVFFEFLCFGCVALEREQGNASGLTEGPADLELRFDDPEAAADFEVLGSKSQWPKLWLLSTGPCPVWFPRMLKPNSAARCTHLAARHIRRADCRLRAGGQLRARRPNRHGRYV